MVFPYRVFSNGQQRVRIFRHFSFCAASVRLLHFWRWIELFLLNYCSTGVTVLYRILIHCETKPYLNTFSNFTISLYITELHLILIQYRTISYPTTLPNSTLSSYITELYLFLIHWAELYPILIPYRTILYLNTLPK